MVEMSWRRRLQAGSLLVALLTVQSLGLCTALVSHAGKTLPCCPDAPDQTVLTVCCSTGQQSSTTELPFSIQATPPSSEIIVEVAPQTSPDAMSRRRSFSAVPYASADPQALLSTFLI
jgi:hypothetical protein